MLDRLRLVLERRLAKLTAGSDADTAPPQNLHDQEASDWRAQGNQFLANGNLHEAESCFRKAQSLNANDSNTLTCLGYALKELGRHEEARILLRRAVARIGNVPAAHEATYLIGQIADKEGDFQNAKIQYLEVLRLAPNFTLACADLTRIYGHLGQEDEISTLLAKCAAASPNTADYHQWYGNWLLRSKQYEIAIEELDKLIQIQPDLAEAHSNRGIALQALNRIDEALDSYNTAIALKPDAAQPYSNRGSVFKLRNQLDAAIADFRESMRLSPRSAIPYSNLGEALRDKRQLDAAISNYDKAIELEPHDPVAYWNKGLALLTMGKLAEGFALYERRWDDSMRDSKWSFTQPLWLGDTPLKGKTLLLHAEQGLGDTIQFCRYVPLAAAMGASIVLEVQKPLVILLQSLDGAAQIVAKGEPLPDFDYHCPLLSLPLAFKTEESTIPQNSGVKGSVSRRTQWSLKLGDKTKPRVGLVWSGNAAHKNDHNRSLTLSKMIAGLPDSCAYFSLQNEVRPADQAVLSQTPWIRHFGDELADFTDTAAVCELMDVVVSVDTSVAHLSASLGKPTWILLPFSVDWRWMLGRTDSPWYPSAKLYRQEQMGDWDEVLHKVHIDLRALSEGHLAFAS